MAEEKDIALGVLRLAAAHPSGLCTFKRAYKEIPMKVSLSSHNMSPSETRPGEPMWHQLVRNIKSHEKSPGNFIFDGYLTHIKGVGYKITPKGTASLGKAVR